MKLINKFLFFLLLAGFTLACNREGIDPISPVDPGPDQGDPEVEISFPLEGSVIQVLEVVTSVNIKFEATDDIELAEVTIDFDGAQIAAFKEFLDYRRYVGEYLYDQVTDGLHTITITATDANGKTGSATVNFTKEPAYTPVYAGEVLYMPFDGDFIDLVNIRQPTVVGSPGFAGESVVGLDAYKGAADSYLTFPTDGLLDNEFSAVFWMKVNATPDRAGILVIGPPDAANPDAANNRTSGFRFFRENASGEQRFKLNVGNGAADSWFDGGDAADIVPNTGQWHHLAFTISNSQAVVYIDGEIVSQGALTGVDWTGCDVLSIMSGAPRFTGWSHFSDQSFMDELRIFNRELSQSEVKDIILTESGGGSGYTPKYDGEAFYLGFEDGEFKEMVSGQTMTVVGAPGFAGEGKVGADAYAGATDSYLTFPADGLLGNEFSAVFWMNINAMPDRAGILVVGPPDLDNPGAENLRTSGFRFFRENAGGLQRFKLNAGNGTADSWFDGGANADVEPDTGDWNHFAFTISGSECVVYINGEIAAQGAFDGIDWTDCDLISIMSGAPHFTGWDHWSDLSYMDELRLFNKALTQEEINGIIADEN
ncbi:MAG: LamG domain-containing protein [Phaeodactylibacter sp.]|nr:LamG domain-containing protein [Phaeodactylibacter sp.]